MNLKLIKENRKGTALKLTRRGHKLARARMNLIELVLDYILVNKATIFTLIIIALTVFFGLGSN